MFQLSFFEAYWLGKILSPARLLRPISPPSSICCKDILQMLFILPPPHPPPVSAVSIWLYAYCDYIWQRKNERTLGYVSGLFKLGFKHGMTSFCFHLIFANVVYFCVFRVSYRFKLDCELKKYYACIATCHNSLCSGRHVYSRDVLLTFSAKCWILRISQDILVTCLMGHFHSCITPWEGFSPPSSASDKCHLFTPGTDGAVSNQGNMGQTVTPSLAFHLLLIFCPVHSAQGQGRNQVSWWCSTFLFICKTASQSACRRNSVTLKKTTLTELLRRENLK